MTKMIHMHTLTGKGLPPKGSVNMNCGIILDRKILKSIGKRPKNNPIGCLECRIATERRRSKLENIAFFEG